MYEKSLHTLFTMASYSAADVAPERTSVVINKVNEQIRKRQKKERMLSMRIRCLKQPVEIYEKEKSFLRSLHHVTKQSPEYIIAKVNKKTSIDLLDMAEIKRFKNRLKMNRLIEKQAMLTKTVPVVRFLDEDSSDSVE